jgi:hypothetical protein
MGWAPDLGNIERRRLCQLKYRNTVGVGLAPTRVSILEKLSLALDKVPKSEKYAV